MQGKLAPTALGTGLHNGQSQMIVTLNLSRVKSLPIVRDGALELMIILINGNLNVLGLGVPSGVSEGFTNNVQGLRLDQRRNSTTIRHQ